MAEEMFLSNNLSRKLNQPGRGFQSPGPGFAFWLIRFHEFLRMNKVRKE
jgi:hypothetical protein